MVAEGTVPIRQLLGRTSFTLALGAILTAFVLTLISLVGICSEDCADAHQWRLFGLPFETSGLLFFPLTLILLLLTPIYPLLALINTWLFAAAIGAESHFLYVQVAIIERFCPVCLATALSVVVGAGALLWFRINQPNDKKRRRTMRSISTGFSTLPFIALGWLVAFLGVAKYDPLDAMEDTIKEELALGNRQSPLEVYLFTDWACPACRQIEPLLGKIMEKTTPIASFFFIDHVIHPESLNFIPYNLSFLIHNKAEYLKLRDLLTEISARTGTPSEVEIENAALKMGVTFQELNYSEVVAGMRYFKEAAEQFKVRGTPTLVVFNRETQKGKRLTGSDEITLELFDETLAEFKQ